MEFSPIFCRGVLVPDGKSNERHRKRTGFNKRCLQPFHFFFLWFWRSDFWFWSSGFGNRCRCLTQNKRRRKGQREGSEIWKQQILICREVSWQALLTYHSRLRATFQREGPTWSWVITPLEIPQRETISGPERSSLISSSHRGYKMEWNGMKCCIKIREHTVRLLRTVPAPCSERFLQITAWN